MGNGLGSNENKPRTPAHLRKNFKQFYRKEGNALFCLGCSSQYNSVHGMHNHLKNTKCGFGDKYVSKSKTNYLNLYRKEDESRMQQCIQLHAWTTLSLEQN